MRLLGVGGRGVDRFGDGREGFGDAVLGGGGFDPEPVGIGGATAAAMIWHPAAHAAEVGP